ncbi:hypothetical protein D3C83_311210 [compost metagenome]
MAGDCLSSGLAMPVATDPELPGTGDPFFYLVAGSNAVGDGPLGFRSDGIARAPSAACP